MAAAAAAAAAAAEVVVASPPPTRRRRSSSSSAGTKKRTAPRGTPGPSYKPEAPRAWWEDEEERHDFWSVGRDVAEEAGDAAEAASARESVGGGSSRPGPGSAGTERSHAAVASSAASMGHDEEAAAYFRVQPPRSPSKASKASKASLRSSAGPGPSKRGSGSGRTFTFGGGQTREDDGSVAGAASASAAATPSAGKRYRLRWLGGGGEDEEKSWYLDASRRLASDRRNHESSYVIACCDGGPASAGGDDGHSEGGSGAGGATWAFEPGAAAGTWRVKLESPAGRGAGLLAGHFSEDSGPGDWYLDAQRLHESDKRCPDSTYAIVQKLGDSGFGCAGDWMLEAGPKPGTWYIRIHSGNFGQESGWYVAVSREKATDVRDSRSLYVSLVDCSAGNADGLAAFRLEPVEEEVGAAYAAEAAALPAASELGEADIYAAELWAEVVGTLEEERRRLQGLFAVMQEHVARHTLSFSEMLDEHRNCIQEAMKHGDGEEAGAQMGRRKWRRRASRVSGASGQSDPSVGPSWLATPRHGRLLRALNADELSGGSRSARLQQQHPHRAPLLQSDANSEVHSRGGGHASLAAIRQVANLAAASQTKDDSAAASGEAAPAAGYNGERAVVDDGGLAGGASDAQDSPQGLPSAEDALAAQTAALRARLGALTARAGGAKGDGSATAPHAEAPDGSGASEKASYSSSRAGQALAGLSGSEYRHHRGTPEVHLMGSARKKVYDFVQGSTFYCLSGCFILLNAALLALQAEIAANEKLRFFSETGQAASELLELLGIPIVAAFALDLCLRMFAEGRYFVFGDHMFWNAFDFLCILILVTYVWTSRVVGDLAAGGSSDGDAAIEVMRALAHLRFVTVLRVFKLLVPTSLWQGMLSTAASLTSAMKLFVPALLFLAVWFYMIGLMILQGVAFFLQADEQPGGAPSGLPAEAAVETQLKQRFGSLGRTLWALLAVVCGGGEWDTYLAPLVELGRFYTVLALLHVVVSLCILLNFISGVFISFSLRSADREQELAFSRDLARHGHWSSKIQSLFYDASAGSGVMNFEEFRRFCSMDGIRDFFFLLDLDIRCVENLFLLLRDPATEHIFAESFVQGCLRLRGGARNLELSFLLEQCDEMLDLIRRLADESVGLEPA
eukprot:TRINITY_DN35330_c1_g1_i1.p1 TRINITY_DN35330_c1_g1~~TRINITY_DN35330_c1_g1_i1.p1  ORF type:complete len:1136 (+),score=264.23 TRINITY_DN35330_c1_g1_i1:150-3557(+)